VGWGGLRCYNIYYEMVRSSNSLGVPNHWQVDYWEPRYDSGAAEGYHCRRLGEHRIWDEII
jgi:hypothetical protein